MTARAFARGGGRAVLWVCVGLVLVRGLGAIAAEHPGSGIRSQRTVAWPDAEARAFAVAFARAYLTTSPAQDETARAQTLRGFFADGLADRAAATVSPYAPAVAVAQATVARQVALGPDRGLVTVAAFLNDGRTRYLTVPLVRDARGGLAVDDLPSLSAPPARASVAAQAPSMLTGPDQAAIGDLVSRFLGAYLDGADGGTLSYLLAPGASVAPLEPGLRLVVVDELDDEQSTTADGVRVVSAVVRVRDAASRAIFPLRYRLTLVHRDRWYVRTVAGGPLS